MEPSPVIVCFTLSLNCRKHSISNGVFINKVYDIYRALGIVLRLVVDKGVLVEAGGIEPPSERCQSKASTCLFPDLNLTRVISQRQDSIQASS